MTKKLARGRRQREAVEAADQELTGIGAQGSRAVHAKGNCTESSVEIFFQLVQQIEGFERSERIEFGSTQLLEHFFGGGVEDGELKGAGWLGGERLGQPTR